jgi:ADP-ribosylglycohydrolase
MSNDPHAALIGAFVAEAAVSPSREITALNLAAWQNIFPYRDGHGIPTTNLIRGYVELSRACGGHFTDPVNTAAFAAADAAVARPNPRDPLDYPAFDAFKDYLAANHGGAASNGALIRAPALATWASIVPSQFPFDTSIAAADAEFTHPSEICVEANKIYVKALTHLLMQVDPEMVLDIVSEYVADEIQSEDVRRWFFEESAQPLEFIDCGDDPSHVRHAFTLAMHFLRQPDISFEEAIQMTIAKGGDLVANTAVVGALVAAYQPVPEEAIADLAASGGQLQQYCASSILDKSLYSYIRNGFSWRGL